MVKLNLVKSDVFGALSSTLCVVHCMATPFMFMAQSGIIFGSSMGLIWWKSLEYVFLFISFLAVARSAKNSSKTYMKVALWVSWAALLFLIINEKIDFIYIAESITHSIALILAGLHVYNLKFCQCKSDSCCAK